MIWQNALKLRCRKERKTTVQSFVDATVDRLGRSGLQLLRRGEDEIQVLLKGNVIGTISPLVLENALQSLAAGTLARYEN